MKRVHVETHIHTKMEEEVNFTICDSLWIELEDIRLTTIKCFWNNIFPRCYRIRYNLASNFNGHVGQHHDGYSGVHGGYGYGTRNEEGSRLLEFCDAIDLTICNTNFRKPASHLITYQSGENRSQIDYILTRTRDRQIVTNTKSFPGEECTTQHRLVTSDFRVRARQTHRNKTIWRRKV